MARYRPTYKKISNLYEKVKERVLFLRDCDDETYFIETKKTHRFLTKEAFAKYFKVKEHEIEQCFQRLNKEGILTPPKRRPSWENLWYPDIYYYTSQVEKWKNAIIRGNKKTLEKMMQQGFDINLREGGVSVSLSSVLSWRPNYKILEYLLDLGVKVEESDLLYFLKHEKIFSMLLGKTQVKGYVELFTKAALQGQYNVVEALLGKDIHIDIKNKAGETALIAATKENHVSIVELLLENKAKISIKDESGLTAYDYANKNKNKEILSLFLEFENRLTKIQQKDIKNKRIRLLY